MDHNSLHDYLYESSSDEDCVVEMSGIVNKVPQMISDTVITENVNCIEFNKLKIVSRREIIKKIKVMVTIYKLKVQKEIPENEQINLVTCKKYVRKFSHYRTVSNKQNATIVFSSYLRNHNLKIDEGIYFVDENIKNFNLKYFKTEGRTKRKPEESLKIRNTFFEKYPTMKKYNTEINLFYDKNVTKMVHTSDLVKWCTSACCVAYSKGIIIDINNEFSDKKRFMCITREIYHHKFNCPINEVQKTYWEEFFSRHKS
jgi:hypothetical protein